LDTFWFLVLFDLYNKTFKVLNHRILLLYICIRNTRVCSEFNSNLNGTMVLYWSRLFIKKAYQPIYFQKYVLQILFCYFCIVIFISFIVVNRAIIYFNSILSDSHRGWNDLLFVNKTIIIRTYQKCVYIHEKGSVFLFPEFIGLSPF